LIPGKVRGTVDLVVNGTFWLGATVGAFAAMFLLSGHLPQNTGWRYAFGVGGSLGIGVLILRLFVPESPRWLMLRGHEEDAANVVGDIERRINHGNPASLAQTEGEKLKIKVRDHTPLGEIFKNMAGENRMRSTPCHPEFPGDRTPTLGFYLYHPPHSRIQVHVVHASDAPQKTHSLHPAGVA
jgi:MFS family permease